MDKVLSIIVPTYNMEKYLDKCLSSLIVPDDRMEMLEVLVVNDGSKDKSSEIAHSFESRYPRTFRVIDKKNGNYGSCINAALPIVQGRYVKILDADDYFNTAEFVAYLNKMCDLDVDLVLNDKSLVNPDYGTIGTDVIQIGQNEFYSFEFISKHWAAIDMHKMAYKRDLLIGMHYRQTEGISYSDAEWMIKPFALVDTAYNTGNNVYCYLQGRPGQTIDKSVRKKSFNSLHILLRSIGDYWSCYSGEPLRKRFLFDYFVFSLINIYREFFFAGFYDDNAFRSFDKEMVLNFPEAMEIVDNHPWVSFIPDLKLAKDWRNGKAIRYNLEMMLMKLYFAGFEFVHPKVKKNTI